MAAAARRFRFCLGAVLLLAAAAGARAQTPLLEPAPAPATLAPATLAAALENVAWNENERGFLLALDAQNTRPVPAPWKPNEDRYDDNGNELPRTPLFPLPPAPGPNGWSLAALAQTFNRQIVRFGRITVLVPTEMVVFNARPGPPNLRANLRRSEATPYLLATLSAAQWKKIGAPNGLGWGDLSAEQKPLFDALLPDPFTFDRTLTHYVHRTQRDASKVRTLSAGERRGVRLRIVIQTGVDARRVKAANWFPLLFNGNRQRLGAPEFLDLVGDYQYGATPDEYGQILSGRVPNRLKTGELPFDDFSRTPVSFAPAEADKNNLTLGEIVRRVGEAGGRELHADRRIAGLRVWMRGSSAQAQSTPSGADVLRALCLCVSGAFRRVGPAHVLTSDMIGLGARRAVVDDWRQDANKRVRENEARLRARMARQNPAPFLTFPADEPVALGPDLLRRALDALRKKGPRAYAPGSVEIPLSSLPPGQRTFLLQAANEIADAGEGDNKGEWAVQTDRVRVSLDAWLAFEIPGAGEIVNAPIDAALAADPGGGESDPSPVLAGPLPPVTLLVAPRTTDGANRAVRDAAKRGFAAVWLDADGAAEEPGALLAAATQTGAAAKIPVWAVARLFRLPPNASRAEFADRNVRGQTAAEYAAARGGANDAAEPGGWLAPGAPKLADALGERVARLARTPGLSGIVLRDVLPPGYRDRTANPNRANPDWRVYGAAASLGYTLENRLAFLREKGADPVDIVDYFVSGRNSVPYFPTVENGDELANEWAAWRNDQAAARLNALAAIVRSTRADLPLLLRGEAAAPDPALGNEAARLADLAWYVAWEPRGVGVAGDGAAGRLYRAFLDPKRPVASQVLGGQTKTAPAPLLLGVDVADPERVAGTIARGGPGWNGIVLDISGLPVAKALEVLHTLNITLPTPVKTRPTKGNP